MDKGVVQTRVGLSGTQPVYGAVAHGKNFLEQLGAELDIDVTRADDDVLKFELEGVEAPIANAIRRILLAEVPTMAISKVFLAQNTSVMQDEVLCHRLGLLPVRADQRRFRPWSKGDTHTDANTIVFDVHIHPGDDNGEAQSAASAMSVAAGGVKTRTIYSSALKWRPEGRQEGWAGPGGLGMVHDDVVLLKVAGGQEVKATCVAVKGIGSDHAKWSPVSTAFYKLRPIVELKAPVRGARARRLAAMCPMGVFDIEDGPGLDPRDGRDVAAGDSKAAVDPSDDVHATVGNMAKCTMCRECIRHPGWEGDVELKRDNKCFEFSVESAGQTPAPLLVVQALEVLEGKCDTMMAALDALSGASAGTAAGVVVGGEQEDVDGDAVDDDEDDDLVAEAAPTRRAAAAAAGADE